MVRSFIVSVVFVFAALCGNGFGADQQPSPAVIVVPPTGGLVSVTYPQTYARFTTGNYLYYQYSVAGCGAQGALIQGTLYRLIPVPPFGNPVPVLWDNLFQQTPIAGDGDFSGSYQITADPGLYYINISVSIDGGLHWFNSSSGQFQVLSAPVIWFTNPAPVAVNTTLTLSGLNFTPLQGVSISDSESTYEKGDNAATAYIDNVESANGGTILSFPFPQYLYRWVQAPGVAPQKYIVPVVAGRVYHVNVYTDAGGQASIDVMAVDREAAILTSFQSNEILKPGQDFSVMTYGQGLNTSIVKIHKISTPTGWEAQLAQVWMPNGLAQFMLNVPQDVVPGQYQLSFGDGLAETWSVPFVVPYSAPKVFAWSDDPAVPFGQGTMLHCSVTGGTGNVVSYVWGGDIAASKDGTTDIGVAFAGSGTKTATVTVTMDDGQTGIGSVKVFVIPSPAPVVEAFSGFTVVTTGTQNRYAIVVDAGQHFEADWGDNSPVTVSDDGQTHTTGYLDHGYATAGVYDVKFSIVNSAGKQTDFFTKISVNDPPSVSQASGFSYLYLGIDPYTLETDQVEDPSFPIKDKALARVVKAFQAEVKKIRLAREHANSKPPAFPSPKQ